MESHHNLCVLQLGSWPNLPAPYPSASLQMDPRRFVGLEAVADAVEHLQSGRSVGKVYVQLAQPPTATAATAAPKARL